MSQGAGNTTGRAGAEPGLAQAIAERRDKLACFQASGMDCYPHAYPDTTPIELIRRRFDTPALAPGEETGARFRIAGRLLARRGQGKMAFFDLHDRSGKLQLQSRADVLGSERHKLLLEFDLGDLLGVEGVVFRSKKGELTLRVEEFQLLAKSLRPPPDKHHGLQDPEARQRWRELELMSDESARRRFMQRAQIIRSVREYLDGEGFIEVETPVLQPAYGGASARPFVTHHNALGQDLYLRIAPELYLKRCLVGGLERVYELGKDFRNEGLSRRHNPEFTMLEWYEAYADYLITADRCEELIRRLAREVGYAGEIDFESPFARVPLAHALAEHTGIDILAHRDADDLREQMRRRGYDAPDEAGWAALVDQLISKQLEPKLIQPTMLMDYPVELSPFAKRHRDDPSLTERFELIVGGVEVANAFSELNDPAEQRRRIERLRQAQEAAAPEATPVDEAFIRSLEHGMPPAGGIGIGIDRLVMLLCATDSIREVILFPTLRPR